MIPFLHLGPLTIPTFGLMVATGLLAAAYILQADFDRRREQFVKSGYLKSGGKPSHHDEGFLIIGIAGLAGLVGARLYHVLESPRELVAAPSVLISRFGFAWFGGFLGGFVALVFLAQHFEIPALEFMDLCSPAAAVGYAVGRIGCLLSGDGDYGVPTTLPWGMRFPNGVVPTTERVHPTPLYEFFIWLAIGAFLWHLGTKALRGPKAKGEIFCNYLILTGIARFLIEFIRINPRSFFGLSNAQAASLVSILAGAVLLWRIKSQFHALKKEHRIVEHIAARGDVLQPEYHRPTPECPHPERWHMYDSMTAEVEVLDFLKSIVTTIKPELVVETGTFSGLSTLRFAEGLKSNGFGRVITCEHDPKVFAATRGMDRGAERIQPGDENRRTDRYAVLRQRPAAARTGSAQVFAADESIWPDPDARRELLDENGPRGRAQAGSRRTDFGAVIAHAAGSGSRPKKRGAQLVLEHLPQNVLQNAAVMIIRNFLRRVRTRDQRKGLYPPVSRFSMHRDRFLGRERSDAFDFEYFVTRQA